MRRSLAFGLVVALNAGLFSAEGRAQQRAAARSAWSASRGADALRPHGASAVESEARPYTRTPPARPRPVTEIRPAPSRTVRDYFPGARPNQSPNRNAVDTRTLCNPGRRALLQR